MDREVQVEHIPVVQNSPSQKTRTLDMFVVHWVYELLFSTTNSPNADSMDHVVLHGSDSRLEPTGHVRIPATLMI